MKDEEDFYDVAAEKKPEFRAKGNALVICFAIVHIFLSLVVFWVVSVFGSSISTSLIWLVDVRDSVVQFLPRYGSLRAFDGTSHVGYLIVTSLGVFLGVFLGFFQVYLYWSFGGRVPRSRLRGLFLPLVVALLLIGFCFFFDTAPERGDYIGMAGLFLWPVFLFFSVVGMFLVAGSTVIILVLMTGLKLK